MNQKAPPKRDRAGREGRRSALAKLAALGAGAAALASGILRRRSLRDPRERDLSEADLYGPHDLAG